MGTSNVIEKKLRNTSIYSITPRSYTNIQEYLILTMMSTVSFTIMAVMKQ